VEEAFRLVVGGAAAVDFGRGVGSRRGGKRAARASLVASLVLELEEEEWWK